MAYNTILLLFNVKLYFRGMGHNNIAFVSEKAFVNLPQLSSL